MSETIAKSTALERDYVEAALLKLIAERDARIREIAAVPEGVSVASVHAFGSLERMSRDIGVLTRLVGNVSR